VHAGRKSESGNSGDGKLDNRAKLIAVFRSALDLRESIDVTESKYRIIQQWDSVGHMQLVAALETEFDIMLETQDILDMSDFGKAVEILRKYDVEFAA